jgi:hypothetical protein
MQNAKCKMQNAEFKPCMARGFGAEGATTSTPLPRSAWCLHFAF